MNVYVIKILHMDRDEILFEEIKIAKQSDELAIDYVSRVKDSFYPKEGFVIDRVELWRDAGQCMANWFFTGIPRVKIPLGNL